MNITISSATQTRDHADWRPVALIYGIALLIGLAVFIKTPQRSVSFNYEFAAVDWWQGESLYAESSQSGHGFLYLPQAGILHLPFAACTQLTGWNLAGDVLWRIVSWTFLAVSVWRFVNLLPKPIYLEQWRVALITSLLGLSCLRIGQSTILLTATLLLGIEAWSQARFTRAACWLGLAVAIKPLAIVAVLLLGATSAPMRLRLLISLIAVMLFPFATQRPAYVLQQYQDCRVMLHTAATLGNDLNWAQLFGMLDFFSIETPAQLQTSFRLTAAVAALGLVWWGMQRLPAPWTAAWLLTWTVVYLMLFNPRTENSTYCMFGPVLGIWLAESFVRTRYSAVTWLLFALAITTTGSYELGKYFTPADKLANWLAPFSCCIVTIYLIARFSQMTAATMLKPGICPPNFVRATVNQKPVTTP